MERERDEERPGVEPPDPHDAGEPLSDESSETRRPANASERQRPGPRKHDEPGPGGANPSPRHTQEGM